MKRSGCPSSVAGKKPFRPPASAASQPRITSGDANRPPARRAASAATALVKIHAKESVAKEGDSEPAQLDGPPRTPLATILPGEKASVATRKAFKPPVSKDSELGEMYGNSDKVRLCGSPRQLTSPHSACRPAAQRLGGGPQKPRLAKYSPHLEDALVLYTPPEEACSEDVKPKCGAKPDPRAAPRVPRRAHHTHGTHCAHRVHRAHRVRRAAPCAPRAPSRARLACPLGSERQVQGSLGSRM